MGRIRFAAVGLTYTRRMDKPASLSCTLHVFRTLKGIQLALDNGCELLEKGNRKGRGLLHRMTWKCEGRGGSLVTSCWSPTVGIREVGNLGLK
jgi:hypothetical protein